MLCVNYISIKLEEKKSDKLRAIAPLLSRKQKLSWRLHPANWFHLLNQTYFIHLLLASEESRKSVVLVHYISTLNKTEVLLIRMKRKSMWGCYLSEFSEQNILGLLHYSTLQALEHSAKTSSYQGKPQVPWELPSSSNGGW